MQPEFSFRKLIPTEDADLAAAFVNDFAPDHSTDGRDLQRSWSLDSGRGVTERIIATLDSRPVGYLGLHENVHTDEPGVFEISLRVMNRDLSLWPSLFDQFMEQKVMVHGPQKVQIWLRTTQPTLTETVRARGFTFEQSNAFSSLNPQEFDDTPFLLQIEKAKGGGFVLRTVKDLMTESESWLKEIYDSTMEVWRDVPMPTPFVPEPIEEFEQYLREFDDEWPTSWTAVSGSKIVGIAAIYPNKVDRTLAHTGLTGVLRSHRRLGIATWLKVNAIMQAREMGVVRLLTDNEENNPMLGLNGALGFRRDYEGICWGKRFSSGE
jgi:GNAT superfamily N-acetyltransferase